MMGNILFSRKISRRCALGWCSRNLLDLILHSSPLVCCRNTNRLGSIRAGRAHTSTDSDAVIHFKKIVDFFPLRVGGTLCCMLPFRFFVRGFVLSRVLYGM